MCVYLTYLLFDDAVWGSDSTDRKSVSGHYLLLNNNPIVWSSKKQWVISLSTSEVEYRAVANTACEILWLVSLLTKLDVCLSNIPIVWWCVYLTSLNMYCLVWQYRSCGFDWESNPTLQNEACGDRYVVCTREGSKWANYGQFPSCYRIGRWYID